MKTPLELRRLLSPMSDRKVELGAAAYQVDRGRVLSRIAAARQSERRGRLWSQVAVWAAAAALALSVGGWFLRHRGAASNASLEVMVSEGSAAQVDGERRAEISQRVQTSLVASGELETAADSKANLRAADGVEIELAGQTRVALGKLQTQNREIRLLRGAIRCAVPHKSASQPFQVLTPDVTIVDVGTVFTVSFDAPARATRVTVLEGEVIVRHASGEIRVRAPGVWSSSIPEPAAPPPWTSSNSVPPATGAQPTPLARPSPRPPRSDASLEEEAQLLRQGLAAERLGHLAEASSALSLLLRKYPSSALAPDARAALQRVEARAHP